MLPDFKTLVKEIRSKRRDLGWSQKQLANKAGVSQALVAKLEQKVSIPNYKSVRKLFTTLENEFSSQETVKNLANEKIVSVNPNDTIGHASELMLENDYSQVPVKKDDNYIGIIHSNDLATEENETPVKSVMRHSLPIIPYDSPRLAAAELLKTHRATLVKEENGEIMGILTPADLL